MPHVIVKLWAGKTEEQKAKIAEAVTKAVMESAPCGEAAMSVAIEEYDPAAWAEAVYAPDITAKWDALYKKPGYKPG